MTNELLAAFDDEGRLLQYGVPRLEAHRRGIWHRSVSIFVLNRLGEILVERRSENKDLFPGLYDIPGGHVKFTQRPEQTALDELKEELRFIATRPLTLLAEQDAVIERVILPEKGIINFERKTVFLIQLTELEEAEILSYASHLRSLTSSELEEKGVFGEVSQIEFWSWEHLKSTLGSPGTRLVASGTESALSHPTIREQIARQCLDLRKFTRATFGASKGNPLSFGDWELVADEQLLKTILPAPLTPASDDMVASIFDDGAQQLCGAYQLGPFRLRVAGDSNWAEKLDDPCTRYIDNILNSMAFGQGEEARQQLRAASDQIKHFVRDLLNLPLKDGNRFRDRLGNLADIAASRSAVLQWIHHNLQGRLYIDQDDHPEHLLSNACLQAGKRLLVEFTRAASVHDFSHLRYLVHMALTASGADFNSPRFQAAMSQNVQSDSWIYDFLLSRHESELCFDLGGDWFLEDFVAKYLTPGRPVTIAFLPGNSGQAYFSLAICQELLERNSALRIVFIPKGQAAGTDLTYQETLDILNLRQDALLEKLRDCWSMNRFTVVKGPSTHGLDPARLSHEVAEALIKADVVWAEGQAYGEIRGWRKPAYIALRVSGRVAQGIHGVSRDRGACAFVRLTPGINHFEAFEAVVRRQIKDASLNTMISVAAQTTAEYVASILGRTFAAIVKVIFHGDSLEASLAIKSEAHRLHKTFADILNGAGSKSPELPAVWEAFNKHHCPVFACGGGGGFNSVTLKALRLLGVATAAGVPSSDDGGSSGDLQRQLRSKRGFVFGVGDMASILQDSMDNKAKQAILAYRFDYEPADLSAAVLQRIVAELSQPTYEGNQLGAAIDFLSFVSAQLNLANIIDKSFRVDQGEPLRVQGSSIRNLNVIAAYELCSALDRSLSPTEARLAPLYVLCQALGFPVPVMVLPVTYEESALFVEYERSVTPELARAYAVPASAIVRNRLLFGQRYIDKLPQPGGRRTCGVVTGPDQPTNRPQANSEYLARLRQARLFIMGAGSLFSSQLAQLAVPGVVDALIEATHIRRLLVINHVRMDETLDMTLSDHIRVIEAVANDCISPKMIAPSKTLRISDLFTDIIVPRTVAKELHEEMDKLRYEWASEADACAKNRKKSVAAEHCMSSQRSRYVEFLSDHPEIVQKLQVTPREMDILSYLDRPHGLATGRTEVGRYRGALFASEKDLQYLLDQGIQSRNIHQLDCVGENWKLVKSEGWPQFEFFPGLVPEALMGIIRIALEGGMDTAGIRPPSDDRVAVE